MATKLGWICTSCFGEQDTPPGPRPAKGSNLPAPLCVSCLAPVVRHTIEAALSPVAASRYRIKADRMDAAALVAERRRCTSGDSMSDRYLHMAAILMETYKKRYGAGVHFWQVPAWP